jgi:hypothetical protein
MISNSVRLDSDAVHSLSPTQAPKLFSVLATVRLFSRTAKDKLGRVLADPSLRAAAFVFVLTRGLIFLVFILTTHITFTEPLREFGQRTQELRIAVRRYSIPQKLRELATRSDGGWYIELARTNSG